MNHIQSLWTGTTRFKLTREFALVASLSVELLRKVSWKTPILHTDNRGAEIAAALGWGCGVETTLQTQMPRGMRNVWALGKIVASSYETKRHAQYDLDVLMWEPMPESIAPVTVECIDNPKYYESLEMRTAMALARISDFTQPVSCGIVAWRDEGLLREYTRCAFDAARELNKSFANGTTISMVMEQAMLAQVCKDRGVLIEPLAIINEHGDTVDQRVKFTHLKGASKRDPEYLERVERRFVRTFSGKYRQFLNGCLELGI